MRVAALAATDAAVLLTMSPDWTQLATDLSAPHHWLARVGADKAALTVVGAASWCVALLLAIALGLATAAALPGRGGALARAVADRLLPAVLMRALAAVAGVSVLIAPVAASGTTPRGGAHPGPAVPAPRWPVDPQPGALQIGWPTDPPTPPPQHPDPRHAASPAAPADAVASVRVQPGDSLWVIAARRLGQHASDADIAGAWPRWYAANAQVIGDDPSLIRPGEVLRAPDAG
jgi:nucleoid-associated protein YgaU